MRGEEKMRSPILPGGFELEFDFAVVRDFQTLV
jgi:hypothetical protein